jgi:hypothetical protein
MDLARAQRQPDRQTIAIDYRMDFARQATASSNRLALVPSDTGPLLMHTDNRGVDHLDSGIMGRRKRIYDTAPDTSQPTISAETVENDPKQSTCRAVVHNRGRPKLKFYEFKQSKRDRRQARSPSLKTL